MAFSANEIPLSSAPHADSHRPAAPTGRTDASGRTDATEGTERVIRLVDAARDLAEETGTSSFTVQQVVERAGLSFKSFYRCFDGKDDLLLALLGDDSAVGAELLAQMMRARRSPERRVRTWITGLFELMAAGEHGYVAVLIREHRRLAETRPSQTDQAVAPFIELLVAAIEAANATGATRCTTPHRDATMIFDVVLLKIHDLVIGRDERDPSVVADHVADFCWSGLGASLGSLLHLPTSKGQK